MMRSSLNAVGTATGPMVGGLLLPVFGWRSVFLVAVPFCLLGWLLVCRFVPDLGGQPGKQRLDLPGLLALSLALSGLVYALVKGSQWGWTAPLTLMLILLLVRARPACRKESAGWSRFYFFSRDGSMTAQSIQRYLAARMEPSYLHEPSANTRLVRLGIALSEMVATLKGGR